MTLNDNVVWIACHNSGIFHSYRYYLLCKHVTKHSLFGMGKEAEGGGGLGGCRLFFGSNGSLIFFFF